FRAGKPKARRLSGRGTRFACAPAWLTAPVVAEYDEGAHHVEKRRSACCSCGAGHGARPAGDRTEARCETGARGEAGRTGGLRRIVARHLRASRRDLALAAGHAQAAHPVRRLGAPRLEHRLPGVGARPLAASLARRQAPGTSPPAQVPVALYPPLRRLVDRPRRPALRRPPDGRRVPADVRPDPLPREGNRGPLVAARADVGGRAGLSDTRLLAVAEHSEILRLALKSRAVTLQVDR